MRTVFILLIVLGSLLANVLLLGKLDTALKRVEASEAATASLVAQFDQLAACASQCDDVILQRQNQIVVELRRLDHNQQLLISLVAPSEEEEELEESQ